ncbi:YcxB family protein [Sphingomonas bacterium]|uniref:YcxB family protein n=1 Tax=Sphingomonas bacterium TaxID=1895847 RepID=UPI00157710E6|nr:YcxB family protein [Sphingomonas bacterium]
MRDTGTAPAASVADQIAFTPTLADVIAANRLFYRPTRGRLILYGFVMVLGVLNLLMSLLLPVGERSPQIAGGLALIAIPIGWRVALSIWIVPYQARRYYQQAAILRQPFTVSWDEAGLDSRTPRSTSTTPWDGYIGRREDSLTMLFFQTDALYQFLPKHALTAAQVARLRDLAAAVPERRYASFRRLAVRRPGWRR